MCHLPRACSSQYKIYQSQSSLTHQVANSSGYASRTSTIGCPTRQKVSLRSHGTCCFCPPPAKGNPVRQVGHWERESATSSASGFLLCPSMCLETSARTSVFPSKTELGRQGRALCCRNARGYPRRVVQPHPYR